MLKKKKIALSLLLIVSTHVVFSQCAMCKAVIENGDETMAEGVNSGITYLMVFPYILVGLFLFFIYRYKRTAKN